MIFSRRKTHFYLMVCLGVSLPGIFFAGLWLRPSIPMADDSVEGLFTQASFPSLEGGQTKSNASLPVNDIDIGVQIIQTASSDSFIILEPSQNLQLSDVLVYWKSGNVDPDSLESIDETAILLGQLSGTSRRQFPIAKDILSRSGHLLFYSLGQGKLIAAVPFSNELIP